MNDRVMKVGELARRTGLTVRTLHHYDRIGLLRPSARTRTGHRLYGLDEVRRLQQITSLRQLGLSLDGIRAALADPGFTLERALDMQIRRLDERIEVQRRLRTRLGAVRARLAAAENVSVDELTRTIEETVDMDKHYSADQLEYLARRREEVGEDRIRQVQAEWADLFRRFQEQMERGTDPGAPEAQELARKAAGLVAEFTGGDPGIAQSLGNMYREEGPEKVMEGHGMQMAPGVWEYMQKAGAILRASSRE